MLLLLRLHRVLCELLLRLRSLLRGKQLLLEASLLRLQGGGGLRLLLRPHGLHAR